MKLISKWTEKLKTWDVVSISSIYVVKISQFDYGNLLLNPTVKLSLTFSYN